MDLANQFLEAASHHNGDRGRRGWRYPPEIRALAVEYCRVRREEGRAYADIAADLGITSASLSRWQEEAPALESAFLPVQVVEPEAPPNSTVLSVVTPNGLRMEGLAWSQALELARVFG